MSKIAILGAGFTGLTAALKLLQAGHEVTIFEKEAQVGGLAGGFKEKSWDWTLEKSYHHIFTNDKEVFKLAGQVNQKIIITRPKTDILVGGKIVPLDSPSSLLSFPYFSLFQKLRSGLALGYLKFLAKYKNLENYEALAWIRKIMGQKVTSLIWEPLFLGKFGAHKETISLTWFWARIKKRTTKLAYPEGGYQNFADKLAEEIKKLGGQINLISEVVDVSHGSLAIRLSLKTNDQRLTTKDFDKVIVTLPTPVFTKITQDLPASYIKNINSIPHLTALTLVLTLKKPFLDKTYWLNITDTSFPFLALVEHTNFMDSKYYGREHILYIGNYLPENHPYLKMSTKELLKIYTPYLNKINPNYTLDAIRYTLFTQPYAQPVVTTNYPKLIPDFQTPLKNVYLANMDMVYPWDRGTNYAIELGEKIADLVLRDMY